MSKTIFLGIDGMDPKIAEQLMSAGQLPNFERLAARGHYSQLATINPPQSPVVWSTIATGLAPSGHGIYDFIHRDPATYKPYLSLHRIEHGRYVNPVQGETFWEKCAAKGIGSTLLKWPMGFPPRPFPGQMLAGLGAPDLRGMLGTYTCYTSAPEKMERDAKGRIVPVPGSAQSVQTDITGPFTVGLTGRKATTIPLNIQLDANSVTCRIGRQSFTLAPGQWSPWLTIVFDIGFFRTVKGICRFYLSGLHPEFSLYMTPVNVAFDSSEFPISHPADYAVELADAIGPFSTLGLAEDTNAVNDGALDEDGFISLCDGIMAERESMFLYELSRFREGLLACVFDTTDRIQHIFWRMHDTGHPMHDPALAESYNDVIPRYYRWMDRILGVVLDRAPDAALICCSDHGFCSFRRSVQVNDWLLREGFLALKPGAKLCEGLFEEIDWSRSQAYAAGLNSIYLNLRGREKEGILNESELPALKSKLAARLASLYDRGRPVVCRVHDAELLKGDNPHAAAGGPDLVVGFAEGYRASWQTAIGGITGGEIIEDNLKKWSGDHCCDASLVPGVLFTNAPTTGYMSSVNEIGNMLAELTQR
ncbi:MAG: hypothetical protein ACD_55C00098G0002 [uncultured bacterium]|uniref:Type I phosphodiesterase/nucleotide pyrophosphatase n=1 Tax=Citrifermentans bemidjiense (strain ATCC BAA-1014 / DSM 16622 / JCM 12645 / Bem) TaxID=404380 RepID=B5E8R1_CITBB|nr:alkaline phosphatase family protein [Citrifermentans bemidjiense]ACH38646.1 hypothetical protein Gbem_1628 [Citrifermentans bemidjiense Bem]EKD59255.1 MAG: hypothetical protein ACD_55C00098G0002 [uncultured bacterium]